MKTMYLEHVNVTVSNPDNAAKALIALFDWTVRWSGKALHNGYTVHVGEENSYLALYSHKNASRQVANKPHLQLANTNHIGVVVDDLDRIEKKARSEGYIPVNYSDYEPGRRFYITIDNELEIEIISYS